MTSHQYKRIIACVIAVVVAPFVARASDLSYGYIQAARNNSEVHINYRGPDGSHDAICNVQTLVCRTFDPKTEPFRFADAVDLPMTTSPDSTSAVLKIGNGIAYAFANFSGALKLSLIPIKNSDGVTHVYYSRDSQTVVFTGSNLTQAYTPTTGKIVSYPVTVPLSLTLVSPSGDYVSWYNYVAEEHEILSLTTGKQIKVPSKTPAYFEIAENGGWGVFRETSSNTDALKVATLPDGKVSTAYSKGALIDDYIVHKNIAYFTTNSASPLSWSLVSYNPATGASVVIDTGIAYTDYMKSVDGALLYYKVTGSHGDVYAYRPDSGTTGKLAGQAASTYTTVPVRTEMEIGKVNGVLLDNDTNTSTKKPLIIWLHGGPERQTSVGFHSYLSYGVYDEMLERFVKDGARVAKIDYTGSAGYGQRFEDALKKKIGVADVSDVAAAIKDLTKRYATSDVYLVGNSYGGYLALKSLVEQPKLVDGVASINGVTDWAALVGNNSSSIFAPYFGGTQGGKTRKYYRAADIMGNIDEIPDRTPVVVAYGSQDTTVPPAQSQDFINAAKEADKNVTTLVFDSEEHILRERATLNSLCKTISKAFDLSDKSCTL